jgi:hypothetical protein
MSFKPNPKGVMEHNNKTMTEIDKHNRNLGKKSKKGEALKSFKGKETKKEYTKRHGADLLKYETN